LPASVLGAVPAANVLERAIAILGHGGRSLRTRDVGVGGSGRGQDPEQIRTVNIRPVGDAANLIADNVAAVSVVDKALAAIDDAVGVGPAPP
jgi:hypothetical protein